MDSPSRIVPLIQWEPSAPLQRLAFEWLEAAGVELAVLRLDLIDPLLGGNKWFKLRGHLQQAAGVAAGGVISLGGAHSNHLHALAAAAQRFGFASVGLLRGNPQDTPTVRDLTRLGMRLHWLGYGGYRERHQSGFWAAWRERYPGFHCIDEGGAGAPGVTGVAALVEQVRRQLPQIGWADYHGWWLAAGTGTTAAGLVIAEQGRVPVHAAATVPVGHGLAGNIAGMLAEAGLPDRGYWLVEASRGAFGAVDGELATFIADSECSSALPLEPLYTAKALLALRQQTVAGDFASGTRLVFVHTGGLQGRRAMLPRLRKLAGHQAFKFESGQYCHE